jgi:hypothetical protein
MRGSASRFAIVAVASTAHAATARAAPRGCEPVVRVSGDRGVAASIRASLAGRGLVDDTTGRCPLLHARVERQGDLLRVEVTDGYGRRSQREVRDAETAVALIESWARPEVVGTDLPGAAPMEEEAPPPALVDEPATVRTTASTRHRPIGPPAATGFALVAGATYADDGTMSMRADVAGCRAFGRVCLGGRVAVARDLRLESSNHPRSGASVGASVEIAVPLGHVAVAPGVGIAVGWDHVGEIGPHLDQSENIASLRLGATTAVRYDIGRRWSVCVEVAADGVVLGGASSVPGVLGRFGLGLRHGGR